MTLIASALRGQTVGTDLTWDKKTLVFVHDADLIGAACADRLLCRVAETGARLILLGRSAPRHALGRNGAFAILGDIFMPRLEPDEGPIDEIDDWPVWLQPLPSDLRQPSLALAALGDPPPHKSQKAVTSVQYHAPRPWRWPGAGIGDVLNLSCRSDCDHIFTRLTSMAAEQAFAVYRGLPSVTDSSAKPSSHPLAALRRSLHGHFRKVGLESIRGGVDLECFKLLPLKSEDRMRHLNELAPSRGHVDVRALLANIDAIDLADWQEIAARMAHFSRGTFAAIRDSLHDLASNHPRENIQHAVSVALAQIYVIAKDAGQDLEPDTDRNDIWSLIPAASRILSALRYDDHDGTIAPSLAFSLPTFIERNPQAQCTEARRVSQPLQYPTPQSTSQSIAKSSATPQIRKSALQPSPDRRPTTATPNAPASSQPALLPFATRLADLCQNRIVAKDRALQLRLAEQIASLPQSDDTQRKDTSLHDAAVSAATYLRVTPHLSPMVLASYFELIRTELLKMGLIPVENDANVTDVDFPQEPGAVRTATARSQSPQQRIDSRKL